MISLQRSLRGYKRLLGPLRILHHRFWRATGVSGITLISPELAEIAEIARRMPDELAGSEDGPRVLFFSFRAWTTHAVSDALIAHGVRRRGGSVHFFTCGGRLPICDITPHTLAPPMPCNSCAPYMASLLDALRLPYLMMHDLIDPEERRQIEEQVAALDAADLGSFEFAGLPIGELVRASLQWFLLSGNPPPDRETERTLRRFLISGATIARVSERLLDRVRPEKLYLMNGIFFAERITIELARRRGIPFITHEGGFIPGTFVFARNDFAPYFPLDEPWRTDATRPLEEAEERVLDEYLSDRIAGRRDVGPLYPTMSADRDAVVAELGLDLAKPVVTMFTNIDWDTAAFAGASAFRNMGDWLETTIRYYAARPDQQLVIRVHPAEVRLPFLGPRESATDIIHARFPSLPPNVCVISPHSPLSSYTLMRLSMVGLVYTSTTGMEMALLGRPVITAGRGYYVDKGFTFDADSPAEYEDLLDRAATLAMSDERIELARRYAFLFFFRKHIPFPLLSNEDGRIRFHFDTLEALRPGRDRALDIICDAILNDRPFLFGPPQ